MKIPSKEFKEAIAYRRSHRFWSLMLLDNAGIMLPSGDTLTDENVFKQAEIVGVYTETTPPEYLKLNDLVFQIAIQIAESIGFGWLVDRLKGTK